MNGVSILGDSISTFEGCNPDGHEVFYQYNTIGLNGLSGEHDTWWWKVCRFLGKPICVNNSYSGGRVSGVGFPAGSSVERYQALHSEEEMPEIILVYLGFNDFGYGVKLRKKQKEDLLKAKELFFEDAYEIMLRGIKKTYPDSDVVCATLMKTCIKNDDDFVFPDAFAGEPFDDYNEAIRRISKKTNCYLADLESLGIRYETLDGTHPTKKGHLSIANAWQACLASMPFVQEGISPAMRKMIAGNMDFENCTRLIEYGYFELDTYYQDAKIYYEADLDIRYKKKRSPIVIPKAQYSVRRVKNRFVIRMDKQNIEWIEDHFATRIGEGDSGFFRQFSDESGKSVLRIAGIGNGKYVINDSVDAYGNGYYWAFYVGDQMVGEIDPLSPAENKRIDAGTGSNPDYDFGAGPLTAIKIRNDVCDELAFIISVTREIVKVPRDDADWWIGL